MTNRSRLTSARIWFALLAPALLLLGATACDDDDPSAGAQEQGTPAATPAEGEATATPTAEGEANATPTAEGEATATPTEPAVPDEFPEESTVAPYPEVTAADVLAMDDLGADFGALHALDPETGASRGYVNVKEGAPLVVPVSGADLPLLVAAELYHSRGVAGEADPRLTFFDDAVTLEEMSLPRPQFEDLGMSDDGRYVYLFDEHLVGVVVYDVRSRQQVGEVQTPDCGPDLVPVGPSTVYLACWRSGEIAEVSVTDGGVEVSNRARVFPEGSRLLDFHAFAPEADLWTLFTWDSQVIPIDLSDGVPQQPVDPISIEREGMNVSEETYQLTPDGARAFVGYAEGSDYEEPATEIAVFDTSNWEESQEAVDVDGEVDDLLVGAEGERLYTLRSGEDDEMRIIVRSTDSLDMLHEWQPNEAQFEGISNLIAPWQTSGGG